EAARGRQRYVLDQLEVKRVQYWPDLSVDRIRKARDTALTLRSEPEKEELAPEVVALVCQTLRAKIGADEYRRGGYTVHTTIDLELENAVRASLRRGLQALDKRHNYRGPLKRKKDEAPRVHRATGHIMTGRSYDASVAGWNDLEGVVRLDVEGRPARLRMATASRYNPDGMPPSRFAELGAEVHVSILRLPESRNGLPEARLELGPEGAIVILDVRSREVLAIAGGYDTIPGLNRAVTSKRQPGSAFK